MHKDDKKKRGWADFQIHIARSGRHGKATAPMITTTLLHVLYYQFGIKKIGARPIIEFINTQSKPERTTPRLISQIDQLDKLNIVSSKLDYRVFDSRLKFFTTNVVAEHRYLQYLDGLSASSLCGLVTKQIDEIRTLEQQLSRYPLSEDTCDTTNYHLFNFRYSWQEPKPSFGFLRKKLDTRLVASITKKTITTEDGSTKTISSIETRPKNTTSEITPLITFESITHNRTFELRVFPYTLFAKGDTPL